MLNKTKKKYTANFATKLLMANFPSKFDSNTVWTTVWTHRNYISDYWYTSYILTCMFNGWILTDEEIDSEQIEIISFPHVDRTICYALIDIMQSFIGHTARQNVNNKVVNFFAKK